MKGLHKAVKLGSMQGKLRVLRAAQQVWPGESDPKYLTRGSVTDPLLSPADGKQELERVAGRTVLLITGRRYEFLG